jgi:hypothetical protein
MPGGVTGTACEGLPMSIARNFNNAGNSTKDYKAVSKLILVVAEFAKIR